jgi:hypothetical protein
MFSFCTTLGAASVAWASFAFRVPHGESADRGNACTFPLYSCGSGEPCRSLQCDFGAGKVNPKTSISTSFSRFCPDLADIYRFLSGFGQFSSPARSSKTPHRSTPVNPRKPRQQAANCVQCSPKSTFFFGIDAAIGSFSASTMGFSSMKCFVNVFEKLVARAVSAGSVVLNPHCLYLIKSMAG